MKKILYTILFSVLLTSVFASDFEGVITQSVYDAYNGDYTLLWHIKGENVAIEIQKDDASYFLIPKGNAVLMYSDMPSEFDGKFYVSEVTLSKIQSQLKDVDVYSSGLSKEINGVKTNSVSFKEDFKGNVFFSKEIAPSIALNQFFKDSYELKAIYQNGASGIPLSSKVYEGDNLVSKIITKSIESKSVDATIFSAPEGYIDLPIN